MAWLWGPVSIFGPHCSTGPGWMDRPIVILNWSPSRRSHVSRSPRSMTHLTASGARGGGFCDTTWYTTCSMNRFHSRSWTRWFSTKLLTPRLNEKLDSDHKKIGTVRVREKVWVKDEVRANFGLGLGLGCIWTWVGLGFSEFAINWVAKNWVKWNVPWMFGNCFFV